MFHHMYILQNLLSNQKENWIQQDKNQRGPSSVSGENDKIDAAIMGEVAHSPLTSQQADEVVRCCSCNKRLRLANKFLCRCGKVFCSKHRHYKDHSCTFDYKEFGRASISKANPIVTRSKLKKI